MLYDTLLNYYESQFVMLKNGFDLGHLENLAPWEKQVYETMLHKDLMKQAEAASQG